MESKKASESFIVMNEMVFPNDTNHFGNMMGGRLMYWMDIAAAMSAMKHCNKPCMTASVDNLSFKTPIRLGNIVHIEAKVTRAFTSSMEIHVRVWGEDTLHQYTYPANEAYFTFVALDGETFKPVPVPAIVTETEEEQKLYDGALRRRQLRLILGGKMKAHDAHELKAIFSESIVESDEE